MLGSHSTASLKPLDPGGKSPLTPIVLLLGGLLLAAYVLQGIHRSDEYFLVQDQAGITRPEQSHWHGKNFLAAQLQFFVFSRLPGVNHIEAYRAVAAAFSLAALGLTLRTLRRHRVFIGLGVPAAGLLLALNQPFLRWGTFALFSYAETVLASALAWYLALEWRRHRFVATPAAAVGTCLLLAVLVLHQPGTVLPLGLAGLIGLFTLLARGRRGGGSEPDPATGEPACHAAGASPWRPWAHGLLYAAVLSGSAWVALTWFSHAELNSPRSSLKPLYFSTSKAGGGGGGLGALTFALRHTLDWLLSALAPARSLGLPAWPLVAALGVGVVHGVIAGSPARRTTAWLVLLGAAALLAAAFGDRLPYGSERYALYLQVPIVLTAAAGLDVATRWVLDRTRGPAVPPGPGPTRARQRVLIAAAIAASGWVVWLELDTGVNDRRNTATTLAYLDETRDLPTLTDQLGVYRLRTLGRDDALDGAWVVNDHETERLTFDAQVAAVRDLAGPRLRVITTRGWPTVSPLFGRAGAWPRPHKGLPAVAWLSEHYRPVKENRAHDLSVSVWERRPSLPGPDGVPAPAATALSY